MVVKQRISYVVRENYNEISHNSGINSLALDTRTPGGLLYTAGKDSKINSWKLYLDEDNVNPYYVKKDNIDNGIIETSQPYGSFQDDVQYNEIGNIDCNESLDSIKDFSLTNNFHSEEILSTNSNKQGLTMANSTTAITIKKNIHKLKQKYSLQFDLRRKKCVTQTPTFNKGYWYHSDWVNDIVLTSNKDHFISASSDRSIYLWDINNNLPTSRIGFHKDDIRVLAYSSKCNWVASGGFDQRVLFWDIGEGRSEPIFNSDDSLTQASIYSIATNNEGNVLVTGSPERIVRIWDTRLGKQVLKLTGHSDNVRALIVSEDGKWVLSGSSDSTIKLWSIANIKRCIMTYSHYSDSVWSLTSNSPYLKTFWAGGRDGCITKINQSSNYDYNNQYDNDYGDCVLICKENSGVVKLATIDNGYIYAATSSSNINCWRDIPLSSQSLNIYKNQNPNDFERATIPKTSVITQSNDIISDSLYTFNQIQSVASVDTRSMSYNNNDNFYDNDFSSRQTFDDSIVSIFSKPEATITGKPPIIKFTMLNDKRHVLTQDAEKNVEEWDIILCKKSKTYDKADYEKTLKETNKRIFTENWCSLDIHTGALTVSLMPNKLFDSLIYYDECFEDMIVPESLIDSRINVGRWVLTNLMYNFVMTVNKMNTESDNHLKINTNIDELDNNKNNNENVKLPTSNSSIHCITPLTAESSYSKPDSFGNLSISSLGRNESLIKNIRRKSSLKVNNVNQEKSSSHMFPELKGDYSDEESDNDENSSFNSLDNVTKPTSENNAKEILLDRNISPIEESSEVKDDLGNSSLQSSSIENNEGKKEPSTEVTSSNNSETNKKIITNVNKVNSFDYLTQASINSNINLESCNNNNNNNNNNNSNSVSGLLNEKSSNISSCQSIPTLSNNSSVNVINSLQFTPLPSKDKSSSNNNTTVASTTVTGMNNDNCKSISNETSNGQLKTKEKSERSFIRMIRSHVHIRSSSITRRISITRSSSSNAKLLSLKESTAVTTDLNGASLNSSVKDIPEPKTDGPINFAETPYIKLADEIPIIISNLESDDAVTYIDQDRETVQSIGEPNTTKYLCESSILPKWAYDCVVNKTIPGIQVRKIDFALMPYPGSDIPSLPQGKNHLCANRMLRIRKVISYIVDKLNLSKTPKINKASSLSLSDLITSSIDGIKAENWIEVLCNNEVLDPTVTLATCKNYYQKTGGEVILLYRYIRKEIK